MLKISSSRNKTDLGEGEAPEDPEINRLADVSTRFNGSMKICEEDACKRAGAMLRFMHSNNTY